MSENIIDRYIRERNEKTRQDRAGALHPSNLGKCQRAAIYEYLGYEPTVEHSIKTLRAFLMGLLIEGLVTKAHKEIGVLIADQVPLAIELDGIPVKGTLDELLIVDDGWCIADIKSVHANAFKYGKFPYRHHELQLGAYELMTDLSCTLEMQRPEKVGSKLIVPNQKIIELPLGRRLSSRVFYLSYVSTYNLELTRVIVSRAAKEEALAELTELAGYVNREEIPEIPFSSPKEHRWLCTRRTDEGRKPSCPYYYLCWGE